MGLDDEQMQLFGQIVLGMHGRPSRQETINQIVAATVQALPSADGAGIARVDGRRITTVSPTDTAGTQLHQIQMHLGQGPYLETLPHQHIVIVDDLACDPRWPALAEHAKAIGVRSLLKFVLYHRERTYGSLDIYAAAPTRSVPATGSPPRSTPATPPWL